MQIRPTKLPYPELWTLDGAVAFVSNAIAYEAVENPLHPPEHLLSPHSVLAFQAGDSFDMACLLVSILTGCGFDAYVIVGYAPSDVVQNDQTKQVGTEAKYSCVLVYRSDSKVAIRMAASASCRFAPCLSKKPCTRARLLLQRQALQRLPLPSSSTPFQQDANAVHLQCCICCCMHHLAA
jgi:hypothetical protein